MRARSGSTPRTRAMRRPRPTGESQMPMTRSPRYRDMASVTSPAGLVKLIVQASGASRAMLRARSRATGTVRSPYAMPPAPTVSWPRTPSSRATRSSAARPARPPTRMAEKTKSAPRSASSSSVVATTAGASATPRPCSARTRATAVSRSASVSYRVTRETRPSAWSPRRALYTRGTRNPPPPRIVSFTLLDGTGRLHARAWAAPAGVRARVGRARRAARGAAAPGPWA